jgi:O-antigen/teichoic acid export membrane protein
MLNKELQIKNAITYLFPKIITGFLPIITLPIFTRILTINDYGVFALAEIYAIFVSGVVNFGLTASYERNFFQYTDKRKSSQLLYSTLAFVLVVFLAAVAFTYVFKKPIARVLISSVEYSSLLFWVFLSTVIMSFKQYFLIYFKNTERAKDFVVYTMDETLLGVVVSLFFVVYLRSGIIGLAWGQCLASLVILSVLIVRFLKVMPLCFGWEVLKDSLKISLPLTPRIFMGVVSTQLNKYILNLLNTLGGVGVFSIGQRIANATFIFMTAIQNVFNPQVYKKMFSDEGSARKEIGEYLTPFVYFSVSVCLLISLFSEEAVRLLTGPSFYAAAPVISILSLYYGFQFFGKINGIQLIYKKKTLLTSMLTMMDIGISVTISIPFIIKFGVIGAAWATLLGSLVTGTVSFFLSQHYYRIQWETKKLISIFGVLCVSTLLILFIMNSSLDYTARFGLKSFFVVVHAYLGVKLRIITRQNLQLVWNVMTFKKVLL